MDREEAIKLLTGGPIGVAVWNQRRRPEEAIPVLRGADLRGAHLRGALLYKADLRGANLQGANLSLAKFGGSDLSEADLSGVNFHRTYLGGTDLRGARLVAAFLLSTDLEQADLRGADLRNAELRGADLYLAKLGGVDLHGAICVASRFDRTDLSDVKGLDTVTHYGPSTIGIDTLFHSGGKIPEAFLRGCGVPDTLIRSLPSIIGPMEPIQFYSCFISYSTKNQDFAERLYSRLRDKGLQVYFAPEDVQGGKKLHEQINKAISEHDKLLLVLSRESMASEWVRTEIRKARKDELKENCRKLFPISLVPFEAIRDWECFDADSGKDLAIEIREYFIPDFSNWKDHDSFEKTFDRLLRDLRAVDSTVGKGL
jgi:hypothetical protein